MKRVRYTQTNDVFVSTSTFKVSDKNVFVKITPSTNTMEVVDTATQDVLASDQAANLAQLKVTAKTALSKLGVVFETETRNINN